MNHYYLSKREFNDFSDKALKTFNLKKKLSYYPSPHHPSKYVSLYNLFQRDKGSLNIHYTEIPLWKMET